MMDNNRILKFQSNNPWLNYIKTCGRKITWQSLTNEQILMYESMFELIVTEKSYLVVSLSNKNYLLKFFKNFFSLSLLYKMNFISDISYGNDMNAIIVPII